MADIRKLKVDTRVVVETPEGVDFQFVIAGPGKRGAAYAIDWLIKASVILSIIYILGFAMLLGTSGARFFSGLGVGFWLALLFFTDWFYSSLFETFWNGQTPGKRFQKLRVVRTNGTPITATSAIGRNFLAAADNQPALGVAFYTVGLLTMLGSRRLQRLGDLVFDTMVVDESREWISRPAGLTTNVAPIPRSECRGRFSVPERTLAVIERLFEGDRHVSPLRREEISRSVSLALRARLGWEEPGPDPKNPHSFFVRAPHQHTDFLLRVLKTFSDDANAGTPSARGLVVPASAVEGLRPARVGRVTPHSAAETDRRIRLDQILAEDESGALTP